MPRELARRVLAAPPRLGNVRVLGIDGPSGAGKSTLARAMLDEFRRQGVETALIGTDDFATWDDPVAWWPRLKKGVLEPLAEGTEGRYRRMDWTTGTPRLGAEVTVAVPEVLVLEGMSACRASMRPALSWLCWVAGPDEATRLERAVARDGASSRAHFQAWQAFERGWFAVDRTNLYADTSFGAMGVGCGS